MSWRHTGFSVHNRVFDRHVSFQQELLNIQGLLPRRAGALAGESRVCLGLKKQ